MSKLAIGSIETLSGVKVALDDLTSYILVEDTDEIRSKNLSGIKQIRLNTRGNPIYKLDTTDTTSVDDDFLVIVDLIGNRFKLVHNGTIDVQWTGQVGVNDTLAGNKCIAALKSLGGGVMYIPDWDYDLSNGPWIVGDADGYTNRTTPDSSPTLYSHIHLVGQSRRGTRLDASALDASAVVFYKCLGCTISFLSVTGNPSFTTEDLFLSSGIEMIDCAESHVFQCDVFDSGSTVGYIAGIYLSSCIKSTVKDCYVSNTANGINSDNFYNTTSIHTGVTANSSFVDIANNQTNNTSKHALIIDGSTCTDSSITNNQVDTSLSTGINITNARRIAISGNIVKNCTDHGVQLGSLGGAVVSHITITGNIIYNSGASGIYGNTDANTSSAFNKLTITGNNIDVCVNRGIRIKNISNSSITGNTISLAALQGIYIQEAVALTNNVNVTILGNTISSCGQHGIALERGLYVQISNNNIISCGTELTDTYSGIWLATTFINSIVSSNNISNGSGTGMKYGIDYSTAGTFNKNVIIGNNTLNLTQGLFSSVGGTFLYQNIVRDCIDNGTPVYYVFTGGFDPEGNFAAPTGTLWIYPSGGANNVLHVKESGTGNTGWVGK